MISAKTGSMLTVQEAAQRLFGDATETHTARIYRSIKLGEIQVRKIGGRKMIPAWQIDNLEGRDVEPE